MGAGTSFDWNIKSRSKADGRLNWSQMEVLPSYDYLFEVCLDDQYLYSSGYILAGVGSGGKIEKRNHPNG